MSRVLLGVALGFGICANVQAAVTTRPLSKTEQAVVKDAMGDVMFDPDSALYQFKPFVSGSNIVCGKINAKNRMGGYVGYRTFAVEVTLKAGRVASAKLPDHYQITDDPELIEIFDAGDCRKAGYQAPDPRGAAYN